MEIKEIDVKNFLVKDYLTVDELSLLSFDDHYVTVTGRLKSETNIYNEKPKEELFMEIQFNGSKRNQWIKLTNPIMKELGAKLGTLSSRWGGSTLKLKTVKWNTKDVLRIEVIEKGKPVNNENFYI